MSQQIKSVQSVGHSLRILRCELTSSRHLAKVAAEQYRDLGPHPSSWHVIILGREMRSGIVIKICSHAFAAKTLGKS